MSRSAAYVAALALTCSAPAHVQEPSSIERGEHHCTVDLDRVGQMEDILSNALTLGLHLEEARVSEYLSSARGGCANGAELLGNAAAEFGLGEELLAGEVERYRHVNCGLEVTTGAPADATQEPGGELPISTFATDVTLQVVLHELGHALIREFDLPVLGNEETTADAFATHYLTIHMPERAVEVLRARVASLMFEAALVPREEWSVRGEHDGDARRASQIAALAVAADPERYRPVAVAAGLSDDDIRRSADYGSEIHRSWRRVLQPLWMPAGVASSEARVRLDPQGPTVAELRSAGLVAELEAILRRFDWHSQVTLRFSEGAGGAAWSRSTRTITVHGDYVRRFVAQGESIARPK